MADLTFNELMTAHMDAVRAKSGVTGKLSIAAATEAVNGISTGVKLPDGITVTPADVKDGVFYVDANGNKIEGEMAVHDIVNVTLTDSEQTLDKGYYEGIVIPAKPDEEGDSTVKFGYWTADGQFQEVDLSGDIPVDSGSPVTADAVVFDTGKEAPSYGGGGTMDFYKCASYDNGETIPAYSNLTISGISSPVDANGTYVIGDVTAEGTDRKWYYGDYAVTFSNSTWYIHKSAVTPNKMTCLYYCEVMPATTGDGSDANPIYWDNALASADDRTLSESFLTTDYSSSGNKRNFYVKLLAGVQYQFGVSNDGMDADILLYDFEGNKLLQGDENNSTINGVDYQDSITYTPTATGVYRLSAGAYSDGSGTVHVACYPAPEIAEAPTATEPWQITWTAGGTEAGSRIVTDAGYAGTIGKYTPSSDTYNGNTVWTNEDTGAVFKAQFSGSNWRWHLYKDANTSSYYYIEDNYHQNATPWDIVSPHSLVPAGSSYNPAPTLVISTGYNATGTLSVGRVAVAERPATGVKAWEGYKATQDAESLKWSIADTVTSGLEVKGVVPVVGRIYSADTTMQVENIVEDIPGRMLCLAHFDNNVTTNTNNTQGGIVFIDGTDTCLIEIAPQSCIYYQAKFGAGSFWNNYLQPDYPNGVFSIIGMPAIEGDFTVEFWHFYSGYVSDFGGLILYISKDYEKVGELIATNLPKTHPQYKLNEWFHHAFVRKGDIVTEYIDGVKVSTHEFTATLGGEYTLCVSSGGTIGANVHNNIDEFVIFDYARYTSNFVPPYAPYPDIPSGVREPDTAVREVTVSGITGITWANSKSYAIVDENVDEPYQRVWQTADGKWCIYFDDMNGYWIIANGTYPDENGYIEAAYMEVDSDSEWPGNMEPIGSPKWKDSYTGAKVKVTANS